jgi:pyruvate dehydrogenase E2 component (dihydrolipoamide acetyltransferase)
MKIFHLPDLGEGLLDAEIMQWYVKEGDEVKLDQPLVSMETAKAVVDVPSPRAGIIKKLYGKAGDIIKTEAPLVEFVNENGQEEAERSDSGTVVGTMEVGHTILKESPTGIKPTGLATPAIKAIPAVRNLAKALNIDLTTIKATGPNGQITIDDVKNAAAGGTEPSHAEEGAEIQPLRGVRRAMANAMVESHTQVVPVTLVDDADIQAWPPQTDITYRVLRAMINACKQEPALNAHFNTKTLERKLFNHINIGIAMDSADGLFVPVIKQAEELDQPKIRTLINRFKEEVKQRTIAPDLLKGSTIQLSNFGNFAGRYANPIVVPPTVAILGTGKIREEVVAVKNEMVIHKIVPLSLTFDHRAVTGGEAARFLKAVIDDLEKAS